jgi:lysozyme
MFDTTKLTTDLERDEDVVLHAYQDSLGFWTIGCGRLIDARKGGGISKTESDYLLANDIAVKSDELFAALSWARSLDEVRCRALMNMVFQMGVPDLLQFKNTIALLQSKRFAEAADEMLRSVWAQQTPARAKRISDMIRTGSDEALIS